MTERQNFIDLDAIVPDEVVIKMGGKEHKLSPISVEDFVANAKAIAEFAKKEPTLEEEVNVVIGSLQRAFPTAEAADFRRLSIAQLTALQAFAEQHNGSKKVTDETKALEGGENPPKAEQ